MHKSTVFLLALVVLVVVYITLTFLPAQEEAPAPPPSIQTRPVPTPPAIPEGTTGDDSSYPTFEELLAPTDPPFPDPDEVIDPPGPKDPPNINNPPPTNNDPQTNNGNNQQGTNNVDPSQTQPSKQTCELRKFDMPTKYAEKLVFPPPPTEWRSCKEIAQRLLDQKPPEVMAPNDFPPALKDAYTLNGSVGLQYTYYRNVYNGVVAKSPVWTIDEVNNIRTKAAAKESLPTYPSDTFSLYTALDKWSLEGVWGLTGIVLGSETPWVESILLEYDITTIEYGKISSQHPQISTVIPSQSYQLLLHGKWDPVDFAFSYSSIEHSGLGRYGDPLDPFGDMEALQQMSCLVKPGGFLFLGFPVGPDCLVFNAHRIYGPKRLELVFKGWHVLDMMVDTNHNNDLILDNGSSTKCQHMSQPVIVMQNLRGCNV